MRKINPIPRDLIRHLGWNPENPIPESPKPKSPINPVTPSVDLADHIKAILRGKTFYNDNLPDAYEAARQYVSERGGFVPNMPEFVQAKSMARNRDLRGRKTHKFWNDWYNVDTEEDMGIDTKGLIYERNESVLLVVHGGGLLTPERIRRAYEEGLNSGSAKYNISEFEGLLEGKMPDGAKIPIFKLDDVKTMTGLPHRFAVAMPYKTAQDTASGQYSKSDFMVNPLVIARCAGKLDSLEKYFNKAKDANETVGCYHPFKGRDPTQPQGRVLFVNNSVIGLNGNDYLDYYGRFVGVGAEGAGRKK